MGSAYQLYGRPNAGSLAPQIVLEDIGAPYELIWVGREPAAVEAYRRVNPTAKVPALILPDRTAIFESAAILIHLTGAHPQARLAPAAGSSEHARFLQWMCFMSANVYEAALRLFYPDRYSTAGNAAAEGIKQQGMADYERHLALIHDSLAPFVLGSAPSAADAYLHMLVGWYPDATLTSRLPKLARHAELMRARPATQKAEREHAEP